MGKKDPKVTQSKPKEGEKEFPKLEELRMSEPID